MAKDIGSPAVPIPLENPRVAPQLSIDHCVPAPFTAASIFPVSRVSVGPAARENIVVLPQTTCVVRPVLAPSCEKLKRISTRSPECSMPPGIVQVPRLLRVVELVPIPAELHRTWAATALVGFAAFGSRYVASSVSPGCGIEAARNEIALPLSV